MLNYLVIYNNFHCKRKQTQAIHFKFIQKLTQISKEFYKENKNKIGFKYFHKNHFSETYNFLIKYISV